MFYQPSRVLHFRYLALKKTFIDIMHTKNFIFYPMLSSVTGVNGVCFT